MKILCLGPHPDDLEFGASGTLIKYAEAGHEISLMVMTKGEMGGDPDLRTKEQEESAKIIGAKKVYWGGYIDTKLPTDSGSIMVVEKVIKEIKPDLIFTPYQEDTHQDHRNLAVIALSAARNNRNILFYETPTTSPRFRPNMYSDITGLIKKKLHSLLAHHSQVMKTNVTDTPIVDMAEATAIFRGTQARVKHAEGFMSIRFFLEL